MCPDFRRETGFNPTVSKLINSTKHGFRYQRKSIILHEFMFELLICSRLFFGVSRLTVRVFEIVP